MQSIFKNIRNKIQDAADGEFCNCHRPHLLTFPDVDDNFKILDTEEIENLNGKIQYVKTEVTAQCRICGAMWIVEIISTPDRRTRTWKRL